MRKYYSTLMVVAGLMAATLLSTGCAPQLDRIELSVQENQDEIANLEARNKRVLQEVQALGELMRMERGLGDESSAMSLTKLSQVSNRLEQVLKQLEDNNEYMRDLSARVDLLATRSAAGVSIAGYELERKTDSNDALREAGRSILEQAELDRSRGNVELARQGFTEFLEKYGDSEAADNAVYWLGDLAYGDGDFTQAMKHFEDLIKSYPSSERQPSAMYKARRCLLALGQSNDAWNMGGKLLAQFPESEEAALLKEESGDN